MTTITVHSPFRIPICGGGSDLAPNWRRRGGFLVTAAINQYLTVTVQPGERLNATPQPRYPAAAGWDARDLVVHDSAIPEGSGLGGSSSLMVALLRARHPDLPPHELAMAAYHAEHYGVGVPCGYQDHFAAALGGCQAIEIDTCGRVRTWPVTLPRDFESRLLLMATGIQRPAAEVLRRQAAATSTSLVCREAMQHIADLAHTIYQDLRDNEGRRYGELTDTHWQYKRATCQEVTNPVVDAWYDLAREHGAQGGKLIGAGGGGYLMLVVEPSARYHLVETMTAAGMTELPFRFTDQGARTIT